MQMTNEKYGDSENDDPDRLETAGKQIKNNEYNSRNDVSSIDQPWPKGYLPIHHQRRGTPKDGRKSRIILQGTAIKAY